MPRVAEKLCISRPPTRHCSYAGCGKTTQERKPFCSDHVMEISRPQRLRAKLDAAEDEIRRAAVEGSGVIDINGLVVEEILAGLALAGERTWLRLCKDSVFFFNNVDEQTTMLYCERLEDAGLLDSFLSKRRTVVVKLTEAGLRRARKRF